MGALAGYFVGTVNQRTTTSVSIVTTTKYVYLPNGQPFMDEPAVYSSLGYPKITYNGYSRYISPEPNYTFTYHTPNVYLRVGNVTVPVISLTRAVGLAAQAAKLNPTNFSLAEADFIPGDIMNGSLSSRPSWGLFFTESYDGYWIYGSCGNGAYSVFVSVDALDGTVSNSANTYCSAPNLPITSRFELRVNSAYALRVVRAANLSGVPTALEKNGTVDFIEPRIPEPSELFLLRSNETVLGSPNVFTGPRIRIPGHLHCRRRNRRIGLWLGSGTFSQQPLRVCNRFANFRLCTQP